MLALQTFCKHDNSPSHTIGVFATGWQTNNQRTMGKERVCLPASCTAQNLEAPLTGTACWH